jgi:hypothetical protein
MHFVTLTKLLCTNGFILIFSLTIFGIPITAEPKTSTTIAPEKAKTKLLHLSHSYATAKSTV